MSSTCPWWQLMVGVLLGSAICTSNPPDYSSSGRESELMHQGGIIELSLQNHGRLPAVLNTSRNPQ